MVEFQFDISSHSLVCKFSGDINSESCYKAAKLIQEKLAEASGGKKDGACPVKLDPSLKVVFDLKEVGYASSVFLRIVIKTVKQVKRGNFSVVNTNPFIKEIFRTAGMEQWMTQSAGIENLQHETRVFPPPPSFAARAHINSMEEYRRRYDASLADPEAFWGKQADEHLEWFEPWKTVCSWELPHVKWFVGGKLNASYNCLDKHLNSPTADKAADERGRKRC